MNNAHLDSSRLFALRPQTVSIGNAFFQREGLLIELNVPYSIACLTDLDIDSIFADDRFCLFAFGLKECSGTFVRPVVLLLKV